MHEKPDFNLRKKIAISGGPKLGDVERYRRLVKGRLNYVAWVDRGASRWDKGPFRLRRGLTGLPAARGEDRCARGAFPLGELSAKGRNLLSALVKNEI